MRSCSPDTSSRCFYGDPCPGVSFNEEPQASLPGNPNRRDAAPAKRPERSVRVQRLPRGEIVSPKNQTPQRGVSTTHYAVSRKGTVGHP
jgi:hypothetical protein